MKNNPTSEKLEIIKLTGVVGAGGAGFPAYKKLDCRAQIVIANGAECEPLLHKDKELMQHAPETVLKGLMTAMALTGAEQGVIAIKAKAKQAVEALKPLVKPPVRIHLLSDTYPAGDEFVLCYEVTGKAPPPGGLPLDVGVVVQNVETLNWIGAERPVIEKWVTVAGAVPHSQTFIVPIGISVMEVLKSAGWSESDDCEILVGGVMMGRLLSDLEEPITKTIGGLIVLPSDHPLIARYRKPQSASVRIARSACDQCSFCTELCPRYLLGHPVQPHMAMRHIGMAPDKTQPPSGAAFCCGCMLCSFWSCPEGLDPGRITFSYRQQLRKENPISIPEARDVHPVYAYRKPTISALKRKLDLDRFADHAPLASSRPVPGQVSIPLKQHVGSPAVPVVGIGQKVTKGTVIGEIPSGALGSPIHASISGEVTQINQCIVIKGDSK